MYRGAPSVKVTIVHEVLDRDIGRGSLLFLQPFCRMCRHLLLSVPNMDSEAMAEGYITAEGRVVICDGAWWRYSFACSSQASFGITSRGEISFWEIFWWLCTCCPRILRWISSRTAIIFAIRSDLGISCCLGAAK